MGLAKVPGTGGKYRADPAGFADIARAQDLADVALTAALRGAQVARNADPQGSYSAEQRSVRAGHNNELRAGAAVVQEKAGWGAIRKQVMAVDVVAGMEAGRGSSRIS